MIQDYTSTSGNTTSGAIRRGFDNHDAGESYDRDKQSEDWDYRDGASTTAEIAEISDEISYEGGQSLKVSYSSEERAKTASKFEIPEEDEYYSSYWVYFPEDFSFNGVEKSGGKLPGLGSDEVPTGGDDVTGDNGFSARYMWRYDGQAELYLYHMDKAGTFGDSVKFRDDEGEYKFFETGKWHNIVQRVKVNEDDDYNGEIDVWLDGEQVVDIDGVRLSDNGQGVDVFYLSTFYGGGSTGWLPPEDTEAYFDEIVISTNPEDVGLSASDIRPPSANPDPRPVGNGVVKGIQEFQPETTEQDLPDGSTGEIYHDKQWGDGYTATLFYTPATDASNWTIEVRTPGPIEDIWNAEIVSYEDGVYTLRGTTKPELDAGETANVRIKGEGHGSLVEFVGGQTVGTTPDPADPTPMDPDLPDPVNPDPDPDPDPVDPAPDMGAGPMTDGNATITVESQWNSGFTAVMTFTPDEDTSDWTVQIRFAGEIENIWNGEIIARDGDVYTIGGVSYNEELDAGETARIKIKGVGDAAALSLVMDETGDSGDMTPDPMPDPTPVNPDLPEPVEVSTDILVQLIDTDTDEVLAELSNGQTLPEGLTDGRNVSAVVSAVDPDFASQIGSIRMTLGDHVQTESYAPYALFGDAQGDLRDGVLLPDGAQTFQLEVFSGAGATGELLLQQSTNFAVQLAGDVSGDMGGDTGGDTGGDAGGNTGGNGSSFGDSPFDTSDYSTVLNKSMQFYYAQYAGELPDDHPISWRGDSVLDDGAEVGRDLSGGWFDAGDHVKFGLPMAFSATMLAWGGIEFEDGYMATGAYDDLDNHLRHVTDYLLQAYDDKGTASIADDVFYAQVGNGQADHNYWGPAEELNMDRPVYSVDADNPGTEVTGETAAALAASSIFFREQGDTAYADLLLEKAEKLFAFSETYQGTYNDSVPEASPFYTSYGDDYKDELAWSAAWLYKATGEGSYLDKAEEYWEYPWEVGSISWDNKRNGVTLILSEETDKDIYKNAFDQHIDHWMNDIERYGETDTNDGLGWFTQWGSNRHAGSFSLTAAIHAKDLAEQGGNDARVNDIMNLVTDQIDFMMGDNADDFSFVVGFGDNFPLNPHHRGASGTTQDDPNPNVHILEGALVGGPSDASGTYNDVRSDFITNEVATDYNAGFSGALAGIFEALNDDWMM